MTTGAARAPNGRIDFAARFVVRAAMKAPSIHNTQPWSFASSRDVVSLYADPDRALPHTDPAGRGMLISGGAALFNLRLAMYHLGFAGDVRLLPRAGRFDHLADVRWGRYARPTAYQERLYRAMTRLRTHHGRFTMASVPAPLITELVKLARDERAALHVVSGAAQIRTLAELVNRAERIQHAELGLAAGRARRTEPPRPSDDHALGVVVVLATQDDGPLDWLLAGQVFQRLLLHATAHHVSAAFHNRPLELADYRRRIQTEFTGGAYPQLLLRLGRAAHDAHALRRLVTHVLHEER